nr:ATP-binding protein [Feifania hominis]
MALATALIGLLVYVTGETNNVSELYLLAVLFVALYTDGYFWGLCASAAGVVGANFFFTYPYFHINFTLSGYPVAFLCMLIVAAVTGTLVAGVREQMALSATREKQSRQLYEIDRQLLRRRGNDQIAEYAVTCFTQLFGRPCAFYTAAEGGLLRSNYEHELTAAEHTALLAALAGGPAAAHGVQSNRPQERAWRFTPLTSNGVTLGVVGLRLGDAPPLTDEAERFFALVTLQFAIALERQRVDDENHRILLEKQTEQMRGNLLRAISHDLRTPLTGILGASSAILENPDRIDRTEQLQLFRDINEDAQWLLQMVENVLSVTRIGETPTLKKSPAPMEEVLAQAANKCRRRYPAMQLTMRAPQELLMAPMDETLIEQVLINLLENAYRHGGATPIEATLARDGSAAVLTVRDHGPGIREEDFPRLFDGLLSRTGGDDTTRGLGIGLSICKSIITAHGGAIEARNAPDGEGAIFQITLPLEEVSHDAP